MTSKIEPSSIRQPEPLIVSRVFPASPELVFQAWSSSDHVRHWFCPSGYSVPAAQVEFRVGGVFKVCMRSPEGQDHWTQGKYVEIVTNQRIVIDMQAMGADDRPLFRAYTVATFEPDRSGGTRLEVTQTYTLFQPMAASMIQGAPQGWSQTLDRLEKEVARIRLSAPPPAARGGS